MTSTPTVLSTRMATLVQSAAIAKNRTTPMADWAVDSLSLANRKPCSSAESMRLVPQRPTWRKTASSATIDTTCSTSTRPPGPDRFQGPEVQAARAAPASSVRVQVRSSSRAR